VSVFADTSALYALLVRSEPRHSAASAAFTALLQANRPIWTTSFVVVETVALLQHRIGLLAARDFDEALLPTIKVFWVDEDLYRRGTERLWREDRRQLSLVDCVSFEFMKAKDLDTAFAIDPHFAEAGFDLVPRLG
jgi:predicted nucleic acid-binding protein